MRCNRCCYGFQSRKAARAVPRPAVTSAAVNHLILLVVEHVYHVRLDLSKLYTVQQGGVANMAEAEGPVCQVKLPIYKGAVLLVLLVLAQKEHTKVRQGQSIQKQYGIRSTESWHGKAALKPTLPTMDDLINPSSGPGTSVRRSNGDFRGGWAPAPAPAAAATAVAASRKVEMRDRTTAPLSEPAGFLGIAALPFELPAIAAISSAIVYVAAQNPVAAQNHVAAQNPSVRCPLQHSLRRRQPTRYAAEAGSMQSLSNCLASPHPIRVLQLGAASPLPSPHRPLAGPRENVFTKHAEVSPSHVMYQTGTRH